MMTEDQKLTNGSVKPVDDPRKCSINAAQIVQCVIVGVHIHNAKM